MKIAVFSDSHGNVENMIRAVEDFDPDTIIHLGDCVKDAQTLSGAFPTKAMMNVAGNCDWAPKCPDSHLVTLDGVQIFMAHGHRHSVKLKLDAFVNSVCCSGSQLGLYGHTHRALITNACGVTVMNPGSCGMGAAPTYGQVIIENGEFSCEIVPIPTTIRHF